MLNEPREFQRMLDGYRLVTAEILYRMPDHPAFLQTYVWQDYDLAPRYPTLSKFLAFWEANLEGPLHSVRVATKKLITPADVPHAAYMGMLH
tara:strand:- start:6356 stop:6631 length:276 start_codon:yes stop_codon:yes gene_type:complete